MSRKFCWLTALLASFALFVWIPAVSAESPQSQAEAKAKVPIVDLPAHQKVVKISFVEAVYKPYEAPAEYKLLIGKIKKHYPTATFSTKELIVDGSIPSQSARFRGTELLVGIGENRSAVKSIAWVSHCSKNTKSEVTYAELAAAVPTDQGLEDILVSWTQDSHPDLQGDVARYDRPKKLVGKSSAAAEVVLKEVKKVAMLPRKEKELANR